MKSILLVRHAKSSWDSPTLLDFDRPLNERGLRDAVMMPKRLKDKNIKIDAFVSSPAVRARTTAHSFLNAFGANKETLIEIPELYHAPVSEFYNVIKQLNNDFDTVAIFSHNPGITDMVNSLDVAKLDNMPTCGVFAVNADVKKWTDFKGGLKHFWFFDYPKLIQ